MRRGGILAAMAMSPFNWYLITLASIPNAAWAGTNSPLPGQFVDALQASGSIRVFCLADAGLGGSAQVSFLGGEATIPSGAVSIVSTPTQNVQTMDNGETWDSIRVGTAGWYWYGDQAGIVRTLSDSSFLGAFIS